MIEWKEGRFEHDESPVKIGETLIPVAEDRNGNIRPIADIEREATLAEMIAIFDEAEIVSTGHPGEAGRVATIRFTEEAVKSFVAVLRSLIE